MNVIVIAMAVIAKFCQPLSGHCPSHDSSGVR